MIMQMSKGITDHGSVNEKGSLAYLNYKRSTEKLIIIFQEGTYTFSTDLSLPATWTLRFFPDALWSGSATITFNDTGIDAGYYQIFDSSLTIAGDIRADEIKSDWWEE